MKTREFTIEIEDFEKFKTRKDVSSMTFFKCDADIGFREDLLGLRAEQKWLWIFLLGLMAKRMSGSFQTSMSFVLFHNPDMDEELIHETLSEFHDRDLISYSDRDKKKVTVRTRTETSRTRTEEKRDVSDLCLEKNRKEKKREEKRRIEKSREKYSLTPGTLKDREVIQIWNHLFPNKIYPGQAFSGEHRENFYTTKGYEGFNELKGWKDLFLKVKQSDFLREEKNFVLTWCLRHDRIMDILSGKFDNGTKKQVPQVSNDELFEGVI